MFTYVIQVITNLDNARGEAVTESRVEIVDAASFEQAVSTLFLSPSEDANLITSAPC